MKNKLKNNKGITLVALIVTIIVTLILVSATVKVGTGQITRTRFEDLKANMLLIKGRAQIAIDKEAFGESYNNSGMLAYADAGAYTSNIPSELASIIGDTSNLYIWTQEAMNNNNINIDVTTNEFFIIDYNTKEIYYAPGFDYNNVTYYSLSQMQEAE